jgi:hypothetical protein
MCRRCQVSGLEQSQRPIDLGCRDLIAVGEGGLGLAQMSTARRSALRYSHRVSIRPEPPPTMRWCVGEAGNLFEQALIAMRAILEARGETHWQSWIEVDLARWRGDGSTEHHRSAYGGMGSFNDLYLDDGEAGIWLDAALCSCQHVASSVASAAQDDASTFRQVSPGSNRGRGEFGPTCASRVTPSSSPPPTSYAQQPLRGPRQFFPSSSRAARADQPPTRHLAESIQTGAPCT